MLAVLLVLQSFGSSGLFAARMVTTTVTSTQKPTGLVSGLFAEHILALESRNVSAVVGQYERNATIKWTSEGDCGCNSLDGSYSGTSNMTQLMRWLLLGIDAKNYSFGTQSLTIENLSQTVRTTSERVIEVDYGFAIMEHSVALGQINGTVSAQDLYTYSSATRTWSISSETWDYMTYKVQDPAIA